MVNDSLPPEAENRQGNVSCRSSQDLLHGVTQKRAKGWEVDSRREPGSAQQLAQLLLPQAQIERLGLAEGLPGVGLEPSADLLDGPLVQADSSPAEGIGMRTGIR